MNDREQRARRIAAALARTSPAAAARYLEGFDKREETVAEKRPKKEDEDHG